MPVAKQTNKAFAETNKVFQKACELASLTPNKRQASKFRRSRGAAFKHAEFAKSLV